MNYVAIWGAKLTIPALIYSREAQLSREEVEQSHQKEKVCIHVERIIGVMKNRYTILQSQLPLSLLKRKGDKDIATVDKLLTVCAVLTNLGQPVV